MAKIIELPDDVTEVLEKLSTEDGETSLDVVCKMIKRVDEERHSVFVAGKGHMRVKCSRKNCFEEKSSRGLDIRD